MSKRNLNVGHKLERDVVNLINKRVLNDPNIKTKDIRGIPDSMFSILPKLGTTRELSRALDSRKVDITTISFERRHEFPYLLQTKSLCGGAANYPLFLSEIRENNSNGIPVFIHQQTFKKVTKSRTEFHVKDEFACMYLQDFIDMILKIAELKQKLKENE